MRAPTTSQKECGNIFRYFNCVLINILREKQTDRNCYGSIKGKLELTQVNWFTFKLNNLGDNRTNAEKLKHLLKCCWNLKSIQFGNIFIIDRK